MLSGLKDVDREILKHVKNDELIRICSIDKKTWNEVCDDNFLRRRLARYPDIEKYKLPNESWKEYFLRVLYYVAKMKEKYEFDYKSGNFKERYDILTKHFTKGRMYYPDGVFYDAVRQGFLDVIKYVIEKRVSKDAKVSGLKLAAEQGHLEIVKWLIEYGISPLEDALIAAADKGHIEIVKYLVERGANVRAKDDQALGYASRNGNLEIVKALVELGADVDAFKGYALRMAAANGHLAVVKYLVENGADIHIMRDEALITAAYNRKLAVLKYLVRQGANPHAKNDTAIKLADKNAHTEISEYLRSL